MHTPSQDPLELLYRRLSDSAQVEQPNAEMKGYPLTDASVAQFQRKIAESIAGLANRGFEHAYFVGVSEGATSEPLIDPAKLDDAIMRHVHPRTVVQLERREFDGRTVDFAIIPKSSLRPHIIRIEDGRYVIPLRGLANNSTAARNEIDHIYEERTVEVLRRAFPQVTIGRPDPVSAHLEEIGFGFARIDDPQFAVAVVPSSAPQPIIPAEKIIGKRCAMEVYRQLVVPTINMNHNEWERWFPLYMFNDFREFEDYLEIRQTLESGEFRGVLRIFMSGVVTYARPLLTQNVNGNIAFNPQWLRPYVAPTLALAGALPRYFAVSIDRFSVRLAMQGAQDVSVGVPGANATRLLPMTEPASTLIVPKRTSLQATPEQLVSDAPGICTELLRMLESRYSD